MLAVCTSDYGEKTDSTYCTYYELQYAKEYNLDVLPLQVEDQWKPDPPCHPDRDPKKTALGFIKMVFLNGIVRVDCRNKSIEEIASAIAAVLKRKPEAWIDKAARGMREETGSVESEATPSCVFGWILPVHKASSFYSCSADGWWCPFKNIAPSPKVRLCKQRSSLAKSHLGTRFLLASWERSCFHHETSKVKVLRLFFVVISNIQRDWFAFNHYCMGPVWGGKAQYLGISLWDEMEKTWNNMFWGRESFGTRLDENQNASKSHLWRTKMPRDLSMSFLNPICVRLDRCNKSDQEIARFCKPV